MANPIRPNKSVLPWRSAGHVAVINRAYPAGMPTATRNTSPPAAGALYAAVELGSDSFRLHVGRIDGASMRLAASMDEPIHLAAALDEHGFLSPGTMRRALACLRQFRAVLAEWRPQAVRVVATSALRIARNAQVFLPAAEQALGEAIEVIGGDEEGRLVYLGVASALGNGDARRLVVDIGSGATELVLGRGGQIACIESFGVGAVRQGLTFFSGGRVDAASFDAAVRSARDRFADTEPGTIPGRWSAAYGACGTIRALAELAADLHGPGTPLTPATLDSLRRAFVQAGHVETIRQSWPAAMRAPHLAGGLALALALVEELDIAELVPVHAGVRMGMLWDLHQRQCEPALAL